MYKYRPCSVRCLSTLIRTGVEENEKISYLGNALYVAVLYLSKGQSRFPSWADCFEKKKPQPENTVTAKQVIQDISNKIRSRLNVRNSRN